MVVKEELTINEDLKVNVF